MSVATVARKDFADAGRSKALWGVTLAVVLFTAGITGLIGAGSGESPAEVFTLSFQLGMAALPIVALFLAKGAISGERESGSLRTLLSLPPSRGTVLFGKFVGRTALMVVAALVGGVATGVVALALLDGGLRLLVPFVGFLGLMGVAFVAIGIGISAVSSTDGRATAFTVGAYIVLVAMWNLIHGAIMAGASRLGLAEARSQPAWGQLLELLPPNRAAAAGFRAAVDGNEFLAADPFASVWFPTLVLLGWLVAPVTVGYLRFRGADIA